MTNEAFIQAHRDADVRRLALRRAPEGVDLVWCLQQIEGWQTARRKLPRWARTEGLHYPPRLSMEQCSSEETARYKQALVERLLPLEERRLLVDLTGGLGVDFSFLAPLFREATYVELLPHLRDLARHNLPLLGLPQARVCAPEEASAEGASLLFIDPARRDTMGRKTVALEDCTPNVVELQHAWQAPYTLVKLSPMLDIAQALRSLRGVCEVHVVSVRGECKELLLVIMHGSEAGSPLPSPHGEVGCAAELTYYCVNLPDGQPFACTENERLAAQKHTGNCLPLGAAEGGLREGLLLCEPNASLLKAGCQDAWAARLRLRKLHPMSNLYIEERSEPQPESPARLPMEGAGWGETGSCRLFRVVAYGDFSKASLKRLTGDLRQANLTVRNFPETVATLRKRLRLAEGGDTYLFATTLADASRCLIRCLKATL